MNNNRRRNFRSRPQKNNFRRRNGSMNSNGGNNFNNGNMNFNRNGSMTNPHNVEKTMQKFQQLAKDAQSNGDPVLVENYLQHADHYSRRLAELNERNKNNSTVEKNNSLDSSSKLVDLGQYIAAHIDLETINEINGNLLKSDLSNKKLTRDQLNKIRNNY